MLRYERVEAALARPAVAVPAIVAAAAWLLWPVPLGEAPLSQDHTVHLFRAWHFFTKVLAAGRLSAWSDYWFAGWPAGHDYPPGADYWMAAARLLTFPLDWSATYAFGFFAMIVASAVALWRCARTLGPVAALLGALLFLLDRGEYREGGFVYSVHWGVWPQQLSMAALLLGLTWLDEALANGRTRDLGKSAAAIGAALVFHPLSLVSLCVGLPVVVLAHRVFARTPWARSLGCAAGVAALGYALAAFFLVPFSTRAGWMSAYGDLYRPLGAIALGLVRGDLFGRVPAPLVWLSLIGLGIGLWRRERTAVVLGAFALGTLMVASSTVVEGLEHFSSSFGRIQYQRLVAPAKAALFVLAAWTLAPGFGPRGLRRFGLASLLLAPPLLARAAPYPPVVTSVSVREQRSYREFLDWSRAEKVGARAFYRIAYVGPYNDHFFAAAPVSNDTPAFKVGFTPASNFVHKPDQASPELYRALNVKWVVTRGALRDPTLRLERRFGSIAVYRFADYSAERFTMLGPGRARATRFDAERIDIALEGTSAQSRLLLHVANFSDWQARIDGREVPIGTAAWAGEPIFMEVAANGRALEVKFVSQVGMAHLVSLLALAAIGLLLLRPRLCDRLLANPRVRSSLVGATALALLAVFAGRALARAPLPRWRAVDHVGDMQAKMGGQPCERRDGVLRCSEKSWNYVGETAVRLGGVRRRCIWAHPRAGQPLEVTLGGVPAGHPFVVRHGLADTAVDAARDGASISIELSSGGRRLASGLQPNRKGSFSFRAPALTTAGELTVRIAAPRDGARHFCFDVEAL